MKKLFSFVAAVLFAVSASAAVDTLTVDMFGFTKESSYADFENVKATSDAVYAGYCAKSKAGAIQMRSKKDSNTGKYSGIVTTTTGGKLTAVRIVWGTGNQVGRTVQVYGSNTAYESPANLYDSSKAGDLLGSLVLDSATTITVEGDYAYVGIRSKSDALYLANVTIAWNGSELPGEEPGEDPGEEPGEDPGDEPVVPVVTDTMTCAAAAEAALAGATDSAVVIGYVTEIVEAWTSQYKNISFWMADSVNGGRVFEAFRAVCVTEEEAPVVGYKVAVKGKLTKFNSTPEMDKGCTLTILEHNAVEPEEKGKVTIAEFLKAKDNFNIYTLTGTVSDIANTTYGNFNLTDSTGTIYIYGLLTAEGEAQKFAELGIEEGDVITLKGSYNEFNKTPQIKNAIFVSKSSGETALEAVRSTEPAEKRVVNGQLVIIRNGVMYNAAGTRME